MGGTYNVSDISPANGDSSLYVSGPGSSSHFGGMVINLPSVTPNTVRYKVKAVDPSLGGSAYFVIGDENISSNSGIAFIYFQGSSNSLRLTSAGSSGNVDYPSAANTWFTVELRNIDYVNKTFSYIVNDSLLGDSIDFRSPVFD